VRYPQTALDVLGHYAAHYHGWIANVDVPAVFASHLATVHVPRRYYASRLPGIPTIRVFEALACGIPLICAPWTDSEGLFNPDRDYLIAANGERMAMTLRAVAHDADLRASLVASGLSTIRARHTCRHRAEQLLAIACALRPELAGAA
jgi:spore maturation protein CgeB